jgi:putative tryptophan/tyrosine transport system substrate-binding protein
MPLSISRRRALVLGGALATGAASLLPARLGAQSKAEQQLVGTLDYAVEDSERRAWWKVFRNRLGQLGHQEGRDVTIQPRFAGLSEGEARRLAAELVDLKVRVIVTAGSQAAVAAKQVTSQVPIVMVTGNDPSRLGLVKNLAKPGGNLTGLTSVTSLLNAKRLELLKVFVPGVSKIGILVEKNSRSSQISAKEIESAAAALGILTVALSIEGAEHLEQAFKAMRSERLEAVVVTSTATVFHDRKAFAELGIKHRIATVTGNRAFAEAGALISYATDFPYLFQRAAEYVDKILKGAQPGELPIELPSKFELVVNLKTAKALGITVPQSVLVRADQVIQ